MGSEDEYANFEKKVKRTIYLDNLSPVVTEAVIKTSFEQYGTVVSVVFISNYLEHSCSSKYALVELETEKQAEAILEMLSSYAFMMSGMPRPVRGLPAVAEMFEDRPAKPGRKLQVYWLDPKDPKFEAAEKMKKLATKHHSEQFFLLKKQFEEEEKLHKQQEETLKAQYKKFEMLDASTVDGTGKRLAAHYGVKMSEDYGGY